MQDRKLHIVDRKLPIPSDTDYVGVYLTSRCFLQCPWCITDFGAEFIGRSGRAELDPADWIEGLNRLQLPPGVPVTLQGGEPFLYKGIWDLLENVRHKIDILTALPPGVTPDRFAALSSLDWNRREAPYPTIRVSYHPGQNDHRELIDRIVGLQDVLSIGLYHIEHPASPKAADEIRAYAEKQGVEFRAKEFLGRHKGKLYGNLKYPDACAGSVMRRTVRCRSTVIPIAPDGAIYRCHSDLYAGRKAGLLGNLVDRGLRIAYEYRHCDHYGLCNPCDVKVKTNHLQQFGYTSVDITCDGSDPA